MIRKKLACSVHAIRIQYTIPGTILQSLLLMSTRLIIYFSFTLRTKYNPVAFLLRVIAKSWTILVIQVFFPVYHDLQEFTR